ncbi:non-heme iron oxygenase ferredoxin subunit [Ramlibacter sp. AW1]|uniref:Non-heme iron oxygenase ferredoxin subunit n=1 Tax=Ramlibacter aurantiacus TaxID=2801330 RepID=A0A937D5X1_9BURK|nr:non-heme iron oxygenase ferredoxin subunit [Ramlibacter aurantiacus]MBL0419196.1 non-heme iron oxygenase ferredoxin subunit [Ramlibacter aurantiacus]
MTWHVAAQASDLQEGDVLGTVVAGQPVALYRVDGEVFATHNICTHAQACMSDGYLEDGIIECPLHQAQFDVRTGQVISGPTKVPLPCYRARVDGEQVLVELPADGAAPSA